MPAASSLPLHPGVRRGRIVARLIVEFTVWARRRIKVHVVPRRLQSQVHGAVCCGRGPFMRLVLIVRLLEVGSWGSLEGRVGLWRVALSRDLVMLDVISRRHVSTSEQCRCSTGDLSCHSVFSGGVLAFVSMISRVASSRLVICLPLLQAHHLSRRSGGTC